MDYRINKWKYIGYVVGCIGITINLLFFDDFDGKINNNYKFILLCKFHVDFFSLFLLNRSVGESFRKLQIQGTKAQVHSLIDAIKNDIQYKFVTTHELFFSFKRHVKNVSMC